LGSHFEGIIKCRLAGFKLDAMGLEKLQEFLNKTEELSTINLKLKKESESLRLASETKQKGFEEKMPMLSSIKQDIQHCQNMNSKEDNNVSMLSMHIAFENIQLESIVLFLPTEHKYHYIPYRRSPNEEIPFPIIYLLAKEGKISTNEQKKALIGRVKKLWQLTTGDLVASIYKKFEVRDNLIVLVEIDDLGEVPVF